jgi:hypothetical protein
MHLLTKVAAHAQQKIAHCELISTHTMSGTRSIVLPRSQAELIAHDVSPKDPSANMPKVAIDNGRSDTPTQIPVRKADLFRTRTISTERLPIAL